MREFVLHSDHRWPGILTYRSRTSRRGYSSREEAESRLRVILNHYAGRFGQAPDLRVEVRQ